MASPNTIKLRLDQAQLKPTEQWLLKREIVPVGKTDRWRTRITQAPHTVVDQATGEHRNPVRHMTEAQRRELGLSRNGRPRRRRRPAA